MNIECVAVSSYGRTRVYPKSRDTAANLFVLTGGTTLTEAQVGALRRLGHTVEIVPALTKPTYD